MKRILWIFGFLIALLVFVAITLMCVFALCMHRHIGLAGWAIFLLNAYGIWIAFGYLRIKCGGGKSGKRNRPVVAI